MKFVQLIALLFISVSIFAQPCYDSLNVYSFNYNGVKYDIVKENKSWAEAAFCADQMGGILAEINSQEEMDTIYHYVLLAEIDQTQTVAPDGGNASYLWLGGTDQEIEGTWRWDGNNDGIGLKFWQGDQFGTPIDSSYENWGNEPDNFSNQDGLGLAITDWARGIAGQWNDIALYNDLFYIVEYDNSTFKVNYFNYSHQDDLLTIHTGLNNEYDSMQIRINEEVHETFLNIAIDDTLLTSSIIPDSTEILKVYLQTFSNDKISFSDLKSFEVYSFSNASVFYSSDFEDSPKNDFVGTGFDIIRAPGFRDKAINTEHDYLLNGDFTYTLKTPIIVDENVSILSYSDVAIIEPGDSLSNFDEPEFKDFVIIEGSKEENVWLPLIDGYDSRLYTDWLEAWYSPTLYRSLYKKHVIDLSDTFNSRDTILIRFRLHSDSANVGWGWVIDCLQVQDIVYSVSDENTVSNFNLDQNYPNPFNPSTIINYQIPNAGLVKVNVYDLLGRKVATLVNKYQNPGSYKVEFNAEHLSTGIYFYSISSGDFSQTKKMVLLK